MPPDPWDDVLDTLEIPPACPQPGEGVAYIESHVPGFNSTNEDCLYLNIYSPKVSISCTFTVFSWGFFFLIHVTAISLANSGVLSKY